MKLPLALRQGGHNDLGIIGASDEQVFLKRPRNLELFGGPRFWTHDDVSVFLERTKWQNAEIKAKYRRGPQVIWLFRAIPAPTQNNDTQGSFWHFADMGRVASVSSLLPLKRKERLNILLVNGCEDPTETNFSPNKLGERLILRITLRNKRSRHCHRFQPRYATRP